MIFKIGELGRRRRIAPSQRLDRHVLRLVIGKVAFALG